MISSRYVTQLRHVISKFDPSRSNRYFLFGSSIRRDTFGDIDLGVVGNGTTQKPLGDLRDLFYDSPIPYKVDVVDFDEASKDFVNYVMHEEPIVWLQS